MLTRLASETCRHKTNTTIEQHDRPVKVDILLAVSMDDFVFDWEDEEI